MENEPIQNDITATPPAPATSIEPSNPMAFLDEKGNEALKAAYWDTRPVTVERRAAHDAAVAQVQQRFALAEHKAPTAPIPPTLDEYNRSSAVSPLDKLSVAQRAAFYDASDPKHDEAVALVEKATQELELNAGEQELLKSLPPLRASGAEWDTGVVVELQQIAESSGIPAETMSAALATFAKNASPKDMIETAEEAEAVCRAKWGDQGYEEKVSAAKEMVAKFGLADFMDRSRLGNNPVVIEILAQIGGQRQAIQTEIDAVVSDPKSPYRNASDPRHDAEIERVRLLFKKLYA